MRSSHIFTVVLSVVLAITLAACGTSSATTSSKSLKVGFIVDKTGLLASTSAAYIEGVDTATKIWNSASGHRHVDVVACDSQSVGEGAVACYRSLAGSVDVIVGPIQALGMGAIKTLAQGALPAIVTANPVADPPPGSSIFQTLATIKTAVAAGLSALKHRGFTKLAVLTDSSAPGQAASAAIAAVAGDSGVTVVGQETFSETATNVAPQAVKLAAHHPDAVVLWTTSPAVVNAIAGLHAAGLNVPVLMSYSSMRVGYMQSADTAGTQPTGGSFFVGTRAFAPAQIDSAGWKQLVNHFDNVYQSAYGEAPSIGALDSADSLMVAAEAGDANNAPAKIKSALESGRSFGGVLSQSMTFTRQEHIGMPASQLVLLRWNSVARRFEVSS